MSDEKGASGHSGTASSGGLWPLYRPINLISGEGSYPSPEILTAVQEMQILLRLFK
jgi:hypothetical protein